MQIDVEIRPIKKRHWSGPSLAIGRLHIATKQSEREQWAISISTTNPKSIDVVYVFAHEMGHAFQRFLGTQSALHRGLAATQRSPYMRILRREVYGPRPLKARSIPVVMRKELEAWDLGRSVLALLQIPITNRYDILQKDALDYYKECLESEVESPQKRRLKSQ